MENTGRGGKRATGTHGKAGETPAKDAGGKTEVGGGGRRGKGGSTPPLTALLTDIVSWSTLMAGSKSPMLMEAHFLHLVTSLHV